MALQLIGYFTALGILVGVQLLKWAVVGVEISAKNNKS
jgi:hypothetical protein